MKILLAGGGSGGPVSPVLAVAAEIKKEKPRIQFLFVGTRQGPERQMVKDAGMEFVSVPAARWRRFFTLQNLFAPLVLVCGLIKSFYVVYKFRPDIMFSAGGFVAVPVAWVAKLFGAKIAIHQQDAQIGLANKLISPFASTITTAFERTAKDFYSGSGVFGKLKPKATWVGNPIRPEIFAKSDLAKQVFKLSEDLPILLILGGATGSTQINALVEKILPELVKNYQVVHQTGRGKNSIKFQHPNYQAEELIAYEEYASLLFLAHAVIARAGLSTIAELSALGKTAIIIPMPHTHQEANALILAQTQSAVVMMREHANPENLLKAATGLKFMPDVSKSLSENIFKLMPHDAATRIASIIIS